MPVRCRSLPPLQQFLLSLKNLRLDRLLIGSGCLPSETRFIALLMSLASKSANEFDQERFGYDAVDCEFGTGDFADADRSLLNNSHDQVDFFTLKGIFDCRGDHVVGVLVNYYLIKQGKDFVYKLRKKKSFAPPSTA